MLVSTLTGTVGWEAMVRKKPVVIFGLAWYEFYDGVLRIRNNDDANGIMQFINKFKYDEGNLYAYLNALQSNSTVAYSYMGINYLEQTQNETINNLVEIISSKI
jgi:capsule polysaccharide export protein KpsC/LpsZ